MPASLDERAGAGRSDPPALRAITLGKCYRLGSSRGRRLIRLIAGRGDRAPAAPEDAVWAVRDVSLALERGQSLGIIGRNGSGKTTLLRLLAGVARATTGTVEASARLGCLLDLGVGFHPLETGRENALSSLVLAGGLTRRAALERLTEVASFAEIGEFFDRPLRTYSAGMQLRLGFATAAILDPEVLITDEVIAVGDEAFQRKCARYFERFLARGGSLVLCSHDLAQVERLCQRTLWLEAGRVAGLGASRGVVREYRASLGGNGESDGEGQAGVSHQPGQIAGLPFEVSGLHLRDARGREVHSLAPDATIVVEACVLAPGGVPHVVIGITREDLTPVYGVSSDMDGAVAEPLGGGRYRFRLTFPNLPLTAGRYRLRAHALDETATRLYDTVEIQFSVEGDDQEHGLVRIPVESLSAGGGSAALK